MISRKVVQAMGLTSLNIIPVKMRIKAANMAGLTLLGGILVRISAVSKDGTEQVSRQLAYVVEEVEQRYLLKRTCQDLGTINEEFTKIDKFLELGLQINGHLH